MDDEIKRKLLKKDTEFSERLEYLIRDVDIIEKDVAEIEEDLKEMYDEFEEIKRMIDKNKDKMKTKNVFNKKDDSKK